MRGERGAWKEYSQRVSTIFVDNLPIQIRKIWIYNLFSRFGKIRDVFIPNKRSKITGQRFGFVRFTSADEATAAIAGTNKTWRWDRRLVVKIAKFLRRKDDQEYGFQNHGGRPQGSSFSDHTSQFVGRYHNHASYQNNSYQFKKDNINNRYQFKNKGYQNPQSLRNEETMRVRGQNKHASYHSQYRGNINQSYQFENGGKQVWRRKNIIESSGQGEFSTIKLQPSGNGWLIRSAIGRLKRLSSARMMAKVFKKVKGENILVKPIGGRFVIVTFKDEKERDDAIKEKWTENWFDELKSWDGEAAQMERFVWLGCYGMPLNVWNVPTLKAIGSKWGDFLEVDDKTLRQESYDIARILIVTGKEEKIEGQIWLEVGGKKYMVKVKEEETFRVYEPEFQPTISEYKVDDDEMDGAENDKDDRVEKVDRSIYDMVIEENKEANKDANMEDESGRLLELAGIDRPGDLEEAETSVEVNSNTSHGLDSIVEDSCGPIKETYLNKLLSQQKAQEDVVQSKEMLEHVMQQNVAEENNIENVDHLKELERNILLMDGPVVLGSSNNIRASQFPSINLQVELKPIEARKALRKRISQSCDSDVNSTGVSGLQGFHQNTVLQELHACRIVGDKLGIEYTDDDLRHMKKSIEFETSNRFAPLLRSNSKH